jgi:Nif-specific regulatory protein
VRPESERYKFEKLLSENSLSQSWLASRHDAPGRLFLKLPSDGGDLPLKIKSRILTRSFQLQSRLRVSEVLTAVALHKEGETVVVEYPYLDPTALEEPTIDRLLENRRFALIRLAVIIDFLHLQDIVHLDIKLDNFRLLLGAGRPRMYLLDLDNIETSGRVADHLVSGTPGHIAPEIVNNDRATAKSDLYSIGRSLSLALGEAGRQETALHRGTELERLQRLVQDLTRELPSERPELLLDALKRVDLVDEAQYRAALKSLLSMQLLSRTRELSAAQAYAEMDIKTDLFHAVRLYSLPDELVEDLRAGLAVSPVSTLRLFKTVIARSEVSRFGDFWHVSISDDVLADAFVALDALHSPRGGSGSLADPGMTVQPEEGGVITLKWYLLARRAMGSVSDADSPSRPGAIALERLSAAAASLGRPMEAAELLQAELEHVEAGSLKYLEMLLRLVRYQIGANQAEAAGRSVTEGVDRARRLTSPALELGFKRHSAWLAAHTGDHARAERLLHEVISGADELGLDTERTKAGGDLAAVVLQSGDLVRARKQFDACLELAEARGLQPEIAATFCSYGMLLFEEGDYSRSIDLAKQSMQFLTQSSQRDLLPYIYLNIASCHTRLAEYGKADHWHGRCLNHLQFSPDHMSCAIYYTNLGWSQMVRGQLDEAEETLNRALLLIPSDSARREKVFCLNNLAEIALYRGESERCRSLIRQARTALESNPKAVSSAELDLVESLNAYYYGYPGGLEAIGTACRSLQNLGCAYYAAFGFTVLLIEADPAWWDSNSDILNRVRAGLDTASRVPLFQAQEQLVSLADRQQLSANRRIEIAKKAYRVLEASGHTFLAVRTCALIARLYFASRRPRLGVRFQKQARALAESISNSKLSERYGDYTDEREAADQGRDLLLHSLEGVAEVLAGLDREESPLQKVLQFAVDTVEAERGVLLLRNHPNERLRIKAYVNCDETSLKDIVDYSQNIPMTTLASARPIYVTDALADDRTRKFKSIVAHNIRSVICVPIVVGGRTEGVIYLDHQTIPALFDKGDLEFVQSLAKIVSVIFDTVMRHDRNRQYTSYLEDGLAEMGVESGFITQNETVHRLLGEVRRLAESNMSVLVSGESGTGKEIICRLIHSFSTRKDSPFVKLNCAALAESLAESELFGVADKTATGVRARAGKFEAADGGTLFFDEIGDMPLFLQAKVLRAIENQEFERVGSNKSIFTDIRFVFATNRSLSDMVEEKLFRKDLYYRVCGVEVRIPPLRERPDDVAPLVAHFAKVFCRGRTGPIKISASAMQILEAYSWPGNVRELRHVMEGLSIMRPGMTITPDDLPRDVVEGVREMGPTGGDSDMLEKARIVRALKKANWNQSAAARELNMSLSSLRRRIKKYDIRRS